MGRIATGSYGVDRARGHYTVFVPSNGKRPAKYVVYDSLTEAKADVDGHKFGYVFTSNGGKATQVYAAAGQSSVPLVQLAPAPPATPHAALADLAAASNAIAAKWDWLGPVTRLSDAE